MKRWWLIGMLTLWGLCAGAVERSQTIVYINGAKYYIHTVQKGETLYGLAHAYGVGEAVILSNNPAMAGGLKEAAVLKIPCTVTSDPGDNRSEKKIRKTFDRHTVVQGETFYAISRRYEIPVSTLIADNPEVDPAHLQPGTSLLIRKKEIGTEDESGSQAQWEAYRDQLNSVAGDSLAYHIVEKGDTFYSLARRFSITEEQLSAMNNGLQAADLKLGSMIRVPGAAHTPEAAAEEPTENPLAPAGGEVIFRALRKSEPLQLALLLPMELNGEPNGNYLEFYQGFLLGLDSVRTRYGLSADATLYNTGRSADRVRAILETPAFERTQLIVGPVYEDTGLQEVVRYAEQHEIPVVSPLAQLSKTRSDVLFQMAPDSLSKYEKVANLFQPGKRITLIYAGATDKEFEREMLACIGDLPRHRFNYKYNHETARLENSTSDLTRVIENDEDNLLIILADNEIDVDRILAGIASANTNLVARSRTTPKFTVLGNSRWNRYNNIDRSIFFKDHVTFVSNYHAKRDAQVVRDFDAAYLRAFGTLPSPYAYRGYDAAAIFVPAMYNDIEYDLEGRRYMPLQTVYRFGQADPTANHVNRNWMRVEYHPDFTITIE